MKLNKILNTSYPDGGLIWLGIKLPLVIYWFIMVGKILFTYGDFPLTVGICQWFNGSLIFMEAGKYFLLFFIAIVVVLHMLEKYMEWATFLILITSIFVITAEESNGILSRNSMYSSIFLAQSVAYWIYFFQKKTSELKHNRIYFSIQIIGFSYTLSRISKLLDSGWSWAEEGYRVTLQVLKSFYYTWATDGTIKPIQNGEQIVKYIEENKLAVEYLLWATLFLELFAFTIAFNTKYARFYGIALLLIHIGISFTMNIVIKSFIVPMVLLLINPLGLSLGGFQKAIQSK